MSNTRCAMMPLSTKATKNTTVMSSPLAPSSDNTTTTTMTSERCFCKAGGADHNKENLAETSKPSCGTGGWLAKVCNKLRGQHKPRRRLEKCEKCGQRSDTCLPNASFISSRKHYLCEDCRVSSGNMKNMYHQLCRNLSLRDPPRPACDSGFSDLSPNPGGSSSSRRSGVVRSRSMRTRPTAGPESGYDTATSLDSTSGSNSAYGRLSPDPVLLSSGGGSGDRGEGGPWTRLQADVEDCVTGSADPHHVCSKDRSEVFGGAFKSEKAHLREIQTRPKQKVYTRQPRAAPALPPPRQQPVQEPHHHNHHRHHHHHHDHQQKQPLQKDTAQYDGYLEIRTPNSQSVKYVFRQKEEARREGKRVADEVEEREDPVQNQHLSRRRHSETLKVCYRCNRRRCVAFRAPFGNGWLCEDCMDDLM